MKSKNRADRSGVVKGGKKAKEAPSGPKVGKIEMYQGRWIVEDHVQNKEIVIDDAKPNQAVYISRCNDCVVQIKGKVNAIRIDNCKKLGVIFHAVVSSVDTINCERLQLQTLGQVGSFVIDKTDGCQVSTFTVLRYVDDAS